MKKRYSLVDLKYPDLLGRLHHLTVPYAEFNMKKGYGIDGSSIPGFLERESSDLLIFADPKTEFVDPFFDEPTISYFGRICYPDGARSPADPRLILEKAKRLVKRLGQAYFLPEFEFYLFTRLQVERWQGGMSISFETDEKGSYHSVPPEDRYLQVRNEITRILNGLGVPVRYHHHEIGGGQQEIELKMTPIDRVGDDIILTRYVIANVARRNGLVASFMAKPLADQPGSGFHLHHLIRKEGRSIFGRKRLSETGRSYLAGMLYHALSLMPFSNPSTNSYRRFNQNFEAPTETDFSPGDRTALVRIPGHASEFQFEYRAGDSLANPYLIISGLICAGVDGVKNRLDLDRLKVEPLPRDIFEAIDLFYDDQKFLSPVFDSEVTDHYISIIRNRAEIIRQSPHPLEFEVYQ